MRTIKLIGFSFINYLSSLYKDLFKISYVSNEGNKAVSTCIGCMPNAFYHVCNLTHPFSNFPESLCIFM